MTALRALQKTAAALTTTTPNIDAVTLGGPATMRDWYKLSPSKKTPYELINSFRETRGMHPMARSVYMRALNEASEKDKMPFMIGPAVASRKTIWGTDANETSNRSGLSKKQMAALGLSIGLPAAGAAGLWAWNNRQKKKNKEKFAAVSTVKKPVALTPLAGNSGQPANSLPASSPSLSRPKPVSSLQAITRHNKPQPNGRVVKYKPPTQQPSAQPFRQYTAPPESPLFTGYRNFLKRVFQPKKPKIPEQLRVGAPKQGPPMESAMNPIAKAWMGIDDSKAEFMGNYTPRQLLETYYGDGLGNEINKARQYAEDNPNAMSQNLAYEQNSDNKFKPSTVSTRLEMGFDDDDLDKQIPVHLDRGSENALIYSEKENPEIRIGDSRAMTQNGMAIKNNIPYASLADNERAFEDVFEHELGHYLYNVKQPDDSFYDPTPYISRNNAEENEAAYAHGTAPQEVSNWGGMTQRQLYKNTGQRLETPEAAHEFFTDIVGEPDNEVFEQRLQETLPDNPDSHRLFRYLRDLGTDEMQQQMAPEERENYQRLWNDLMNWMPGLVENRQQPQYAG